MPLDRIEAPYYVCNPRPRLQQGDLLRDLTVSEVSVASTEGASVDKRPVPYCVVLSQDCDLLHDFNSSLAQGDRNDDKTLPAFLFCPAYRTEFFRAGTHLEDQNKTMRRIDSNKEWEKIASNQSLRYHYLERRDDLQVPELVVDFKHYFTIPRPLVYREEFRKSYFVTLEILYRDHLSSRFAHYLSRIGLPELTSP